MNDKKILAFDFDGTLVNSMGHLTAIAQEVMSKHFDISPKKAKALYEMTSGLAFPKQLQAIFPKHKEKREVAAKEFEKKKRAEYETHPLFEDTHETITYLKEREYTVIISSNSEQDLVDRLVRQLKIPCDLALGFAEPMEKGFPHFLYIMEHWGGNPNEMVFIGDSLKDGERAFESGIDFIGVEGIFSRKIFQNRFPGVTVISRLAELKEIF